MIPISSEKVLKIPDPDGSDVIYHLRYLLDEQQPQFLELYDQLQKGRESFLSVSKKEIEKEYRGKRFKKGEKESLVYARSSLLYFQSIRENAVNFVKFMDSWINLFLCGWESKKTKIDPFPGDNRPSRCFGLQDKFIAFTMVMNSIDELCMLKADEVKK